MLPYPSLTTMSNIRPNSNFNIQRPAPIIRNKRTRAKRSCDQCRKKKIRCDADVKKPCTGCHNSGMQCEFLVEQKKRGPATGYSSRKSNYVETLENRLKRMEAMLTTMTQEKETVLHNNMTNDTCSETSISTNDIENSPNSITESLMYSPNITNTLPNNNNNNNNNNDNPSKEKKEKEKEKEKGDFFCHDIIGATDELTDKFDKVNITDYQQTRYLGMSAGLHLLNEKLFSSNKKHHNNNGELSFFIQKLNNDEDEHIIIKSTTSKKVPQGQNCAQYIEALNIPYINQTRTDFLIETYFTYCHPLCPVINKMSFLEQYYYQDPCPPDEYLFCVICAIGIQILLISKRVNWLPCMLDLDEENLTLMKESFEKKAQEIFDIYYRRSRISTLQTLILFAAYGDILNCQTELGIYWLLTGNVIRMGQDLGLHCNSSKLQIPKPEMEQRRRIWHMIYMIDRMVAAAYGRPVSIQDNDCDVEMPSIYEIEPFYNKPLSNRPFIPEIILQTQSDITNKKPIYAYFYHSTSLCQLFGQILSSLHVSRTKSLSIQLQQLAGKLDQKLNEWRIDLPSYLFYDVKNPSEQTSDSELLFLLYNCTLLLLYRPFITNNGKCNDCDFAYNSLRICTVAANNILLVSEHLNKFVLCSIPCGIPIYSLFQAAVIYVVSAKGENKYLSHQAIKSLLLCAQMIKNKGRIGASLLAQQISVVLQSLNSRFSHEIDGRELPNSHYENTTTTTTTTTTQECKTISDNMKDEIIRNPNYANQIQQELSSMVDKNDGSFDQSGCKLTALQHIKSTRPEDMFLSSLTMGVQLRSSSTTPDLPSPTIKINCSNTVAPESFVQDVVDDNMGDQQQSQQQQQQQQRVDQLMDIDILSWNMRTDPEPEVYSCIIEQEQQQQYQQQQQHYDMTILSNEVPYWNLQNSINLNEWDIFSKPNTNN